MTTISAKVIADSLSVKGSRLTTLQLRYPRWIHAEGRTHRVISISEEFEFEPMTPSLMESRELSRNASSSRAMPVKRLIQDVIDDPAIPIYWGKNQKGMQADGHEHNARIQTWAYDTNQGNSWSREEAWLYARDQAVIMAKAFDEAGYAKQLVNRLLEPFSHINVVVTASKWNNFLGLRDHKDAEPHIWHLARAVKQAREQSEPRQLKLGEWHLPYFNEPLEPDDKKGLWQALQCSVARCARVSYLTSEGKPPSLEADLALFNVLVTQRPLHASPAEHQATSQAKVLGIEVSDIPGYEGVYHPPMAIIAGNLGYDWVQFRKCLPYEDLEDLEPAPSLPV